MSLILRYAILSVCRRYKRNLLTLGAMLMGVASLVALMGITESSALHSAQRLEKYESRHVQVRLQSDMWEVSEQVLAERMGQVPSVEKGGTLTFEERASLEVSPLTRTATKSVKLVFASKAGLEARGASFVEGTYYDSANKPDSPTVMLGTALAKELGVSSSPGKNRLLVNGQIMNVAAVVKDSDENAALALALIVSPESQLFPQQSQMQRVLDIKVAEGSAKVAGDELKRVLDPARPHDVNIALAPSAQELKRQLTEDSDLLVLVILGVTLLSTGFGIMMTMLMSVWERRRDIGISRALGTSRSHIAFSYLVEAIIVGAAGAVLGFILGMCIVLAVTIYSGWELSVPPQTALLPLFGAVIGAVSGAIPAYQAAQVEPLELLK